MESDECVETTDSINNMIGEMAAEYVTQFYLNIIEYLYDETFGRLLLLCVIQRFNQQYYWLTLPGKCAIVLYL